MVFHVRENHKLQSVNVVEQFTTSTNLITNLKLTIMNKKIEIQVPEGKVAEWKVIDGVKTLVLTDEKYQRPVTERIKRYVELILNCK